MKNIFRLFIWDQPKGRHVKWGKVESVILKDRSYTLDEFKKKEFTHYDIFDDIETLVVSLHEEPGKQRPYPDFLTISFRFFGINNKVEDLLKTNNIEYKTKPIVVNNDSGIEYKLVWFPDLPLLDLEKSNVELKAGKAVTRGKDYFNTVLSAIILNNNANSIEGIVRIKELPSTLVCTEEVKKVLEKSNLTGFEFKELEVVDYESVH